MSKNKKKTRQVVEENKDLNNGRILLEELIASFNGKTNPIRCFSSYQILKATDNFSESQVISSWVYFKWYRGVIEDRPVSIKKWTSEYLSSYTEAYRDISVSSQMSGHKNSLKLIGCCLEFDSPALVCESTLHGPLNRDGVFSSGYVLPWKIRLKIAKEIATALSYLHTAFPETIIHRFISPASFFIDRNWTAKLSDFWFCIAIPKEELYVKDESKGVIGFVDPDYINTYKVTEQVDIYSFGVVMLVLLSGRAAKGHEIRYTRLVDHVFDAIEICGFEEIVDKAIWNASRDLVSRRSRVKEIVDKEIWNTPSGELVTRRSQVEAFLDLALRCVRYKRAEPMNSMIEVAKELKLIEKLSLN